MTVHTSSAFTNPSPVDTTERGTAVTSPNSAGPSTFTDSDIFNGAARISTAYAPKLLPSDLTAAGSRSSGASQSRR